MPLLKGTQVASTGPLDGPSKLAADPLRDQADWPLLARTFFTRPTLRAPRRTLFPASTAYVNGPSKLACCHPGTARMSFLLRPWREHLPQFVNLISPACALRERSEEHTSELQSQSNLVCRLL